MCTHTDLAAETLVLHVHLAPLRRIFWNDFLDGGKVEKNWIENRHAVTLLQRACAVESENIDFWPKETGFEKRLWT